MRYGRGGGCDEGERRRREGVRLRAAARFERGDKTADIAREEQVSIRHVEMWRRAWRTGGVTALASKGPAGAVAKLDEAQFARLAAELARGSLAHGWPDQRWTLARVAEMIKRLFGVSYTLKGVSLLLHRHGWSVQVPARRAVERDPQAVRSWQQEVWPALKPSSGPREPG